MYARDGIGDGYRCRRPISNHTGGYRTTPPQSKGRLRTPGSIRTPGKSGGESSSRSLSIGAGLPSPTATSPHGTAHRLRRSPSPSPTAGSSPGGGGVRPGALGRGDSGPSRDLHLAQLPRRRDRASRIAPRFPLLPRVVVRPLEAATEARPPLARRTAAGTLPRLASPVIPGRAGLVVCLPVRLAQRQPRRRRAGAPPAKPLPPTVRLGLPLVPNRPPRAGLAGLPPRPRLPATVPVGAHARLFRGHQQTTPAKRITDTASSHSPVRAM